MYFTIFISLLVLQRLSELLIARRNEKWLLSQGAVEYGQSHYPFMIAMHTLFIVSIIIEYNLRGGTEISWIFLGIFLAVLGAIVVREILEHKNLPYSRCLSC